jgi:hypothetical protein
MLKGANEFQLPVLGQITLLTDQGSLNDAAQMIEKGFLWLVDGYDVRKGYDKKERNLRGCAVLAYGQDD